MALIVGTDSYISQADASTYLSGAYISTDAKLIAWTALSSADKDVLLRSAASIIDRQPLNGTKVILTQVMKFPRIVYTEAAGYSYFIASHPNDSNLYLEPSVPVEVQHAQCEIAIGLIVGNQPKREQLQREGVRSFSVGGLSESYAGSGSVVSAIPSVKAVDMLRPFLAGSVRIC